MRYGVMFLTLFVLPCLVDAGTMYHWKDEFGQTHYTDNLGLVPEKYQEHSERRLPDFESPLGPTSAGVEKSSWQNKCESCHYIGAEKAPGGLVSISSLLMDSNKEDLNEPKMVEVAVEHTLSNSHVSLVSPKLSQDEIKALALELLQMQQNALWSDPDRN